MEFSQTLFKLDSLQRERILHIYTIEGELIQESGLINGNKVIHKKMCISKNTNKSNQTTPQEQAVLQAKSKIEEKLTEGYFRTIEEAKSIKVVMPMLALSYNDEKHKINWKESVYASRKLDGMRCHIVVENGTIKLMSRAGKEILTMDHIKTILYNIVTPTTNFILDGELYADGYNFQENMRMIKKVGPDTTKIGFHIYDVVSALPYNDRYAFAEKVVNKINSPNILLVLSVQIYSEDGLKTCHKYFISEGYEGTMIRHSNIGYESNKRSSSLLKYKDFQDIALPIIDITPNDANPLHGTPWFELNGKGFKSGLKMSHSEREDLLLNKEKHISQIAEIRYFELTEDGVPRFPVMIGFREDK